MEFDKDLISEFSKNLTVAQLERDYISKGYTAVEMEDTFPFYPDLFFEKDDEKILIQVKPIFAGIGDVDKISALHQYSKAHNNTKLSIVFSTLPNQTEIDFPDLVEMLLEYLQNTENEVINDLHDIASHPSIKWVDDLEINSLYIDRDGMTAKGTASVEVNLHYGGGGDELEFEESFPMEFEAELLIAESKIQLSKVSCKVDTSSWSE